MTATVRPDYGRTLEGAARDVVDACSISPGHVVLDVAAGTGNCAIEAARMGARVVACDLTRAMVEIVRARTEEEGAERRVIRRRRGRPALRGPVDSTS